MVIPKHQISTIKLDTRPKMPECTDHYLSDYYATNGKILAERIPTNTTPIIGKFPNVNTEFDFNFIPLHIVERLTKDIDIHKSSGIVDLNAELIRDAFLVLNVELTHLLNESISQQIFPSKWAIGSVTPIPKDGNLLDPGNWRPITILPIPSKIMERAIHFQLLNYFEGNNYLHPRQHGFRKSYSTSTAIHRMLRNVYDAYDLGLSTSCAFVDYKKAFETLDHDILLQKLKLYGLSDCSLAWMKSYLENRKHTVYCNNNISKESTVSYGVPQGSILGPSLFIMYVNDLLYTLFDYPKINVEMYADDTVIYTSDHDPKVACVNNERIINILYNWCNKNKLTINFKKTKHMMILRNRQLQNPDNFNFNIEVENKHIENVVSYHYLGVDLDNGLTYDKMLDNMFKKANRKLFMLKRIRPYITNSISNLVYKTHVLPMLDYADFLVESGHMEKIDRLNNLQKRAVKLIDNKLHRGLDSNQLMNIYNLEPLLKRRERHHLVLMYRLKADSENLDTHRPGISLRSNNKIKFRNRTTKLTKVLNSPYYRGVRLWDRLSEETQKATTKVKFKKSL